MSEQLYRCERVVAFPLSGGEASVSLMGGMASVRVPADIASALPELLTFRSLDAHARALATRAGREETDELVRGALARLVEAGALIERRALLEACLHAAQKQRAPARIASVCFATRERVPQLARAVASFAENARQHGDACDFVVFDDARTPARREECRAMLAELASARGARVRYAARDEKRAFADALAREADVPRDLVRHALLGSRDWPVTLGANRNCALLDRAGEPFLFADDDVEARVAASPSRPTHALSFAPDGGEVQFFSDRRAAVEAAEPVAESIVRTHEAVLGRSFGELLSGVEETASLDDVDLDAMTPEMLRDLRTGRGRVVMTFCGIYGDGAIDRPTVPLSVGTAISNALLADRALFETAMTSREVFRYVGQLTVCRPTCVCIAASMALDGRELLPPFVPPSWGEDSLFALTTERCDPSAHAALLPRAVLHAAVGRGAYLPADRALTRPVRFLVGHLLASAAAPPRHAEHDVEARMLNLGKYLVDLADRPATLADAARDHGRRIDAARVASLQRAIASAPPDAPWFLREAEEELRLSERFLREGDYVTPSEPLDRCSKDEARARAFALIRRFGELLRAWPALLAAAQRLRERGVHLAAPITRST